jgi:multidrug efflux pump subunit AcrB
MQLLRALIAGGVRNHVAVNLLMLCILAGGFFSTRRMVREAYPELSLDHIAVEVLYPGASPADVEYAICTPIEEAIQGIPGVREISSAAQDNGGTVWAALAYDLKDPQRVVDEIKDRVGQIRTFPPDAERPVVQETRLRAPVINIAVHGDVPERTLKRYAQEIRNELEVLPEISQVSLSGVRDDEIIIEFSKEALLAYDLSMGQVMNIVKRGAFDLPAGVIRTAGEEFTLRITGKRYLAREYEDLVLLEHGNALVRLGDIATVREGFEDVALKSRYNDAPAVLVTVYKTSQEDAIKIANAVREYVAARQVGLPDRVQLSAWGDTSVEIDSRISTLLSNGLQGLVLLFLTLWIFLEFRLAFWVAVGIPISYAGALIVMDFTDQTINLYSLFALIMVSGIIVDDSIVIGESIYKRREAGDPPELAAIEGTSRIAIPVLGSTATSIVAFLPLMFVVGVMGKLVYVLPMVVIAALVASTIEGFVIQPAHLAYGGGPGPGRDGKPRRRTRARDTIDRWVDFVITEIYRPVYRLAIRYRGAAVALALAITVLTAGIWMSGRLPFVLLPKEDGRILRARVRYPEGSPVGITEKTMHRLQQAALALNDDPALVPAEPGPLVQGIYAIAGEFADFLPIRGSNLCEVWIELMPSEQREIGDDRIIERWRAHLGELHDAIQFTIERQQIGPTIYPIEIRLLGDDFENLADASQRIQQRLREFAGVEHVHDDLEPGKRELQITLRPLSRSLGVTLDDVASQLRYGFFGGEALRLQRGQDQVKVRVRFPEEDRQSIAALETVRIRTAIGGEVPLLEVANVRWDRGYSTVFHQDNKRRVRIFADIDERIGNAEQVIRTMQAGFIQDVVKDYNDVTYVLGGSTQMLTESFTSLREGFLLALFVNYCLLAAVLRSYSKPLIIIAAVPFGFVGVVLGHLLFGFDLTMMSLFGTVGVAGLVVNEALVLVDSINWLIREGKSVTQAVEEVGELRFRPIVLTSITDMAGLLPLLLNSSSQVQSVQPMAIALSFGLLTAAVLNLLVVPALYLMVNDARRFTHWLRHGGAYPVREWVEEAARDRNLAAATAS